GMAGAMMLPVGRLVLLKTVPKSQLVAAMAVLTMPALLGPIIGPVLGGAIVTYSSWRWIFFINLPMGLLGLALVAKFVPDICEANVPPFDTRGFVLTALGLGCLVFALENVGRGTLSSVSILLLAAAGSAALIVYVAHARRVPWPAVDLMLFRIPTFT